MSRKLRCYTSGPILAGEENPLLDSQTNIQAKLPAKAVPSRVWMHRLSTLGAASETTIGVGYDGDNTTGNDGTVFPLSQGVTHVVLNNKDSVLYQGPSRSDAQTTDMGLCALCNDNITSGQWEVVVEYTLYSDL